MNRRPTRVTREAGGLMSRIRERGWVRSLTDVDRPGVRVVCFPHSGGSAIAFGAWSAAVPHGAALMAVQYPGRGDRFAEPPVDDVAAMAGCASAELLRLPPGDRILFGHSLGALVAYETALLLRDAGEEPLALCVSAALPPGQMRDRDIHRAPDDEFWSKLCALGGIEPGVADHAELRELLLPTLRSDLRAHATYEPRPGARPLSCPVRCYHGAGDPLVEEERLAGWAGVTSGGFGLTVRPGGHFHVATGTAELVADVLAQGGK
ncbi:thioesterase [Streptomyces sp. p1417]|uniref:Thioesterase n=2 Tax=Streptomyces typhae TaxID=2681492 RepID=A0A6L6X686_9ACTN|nr:thioesterase [Streptomyces typhae]